MKKRVLAIILVVTMLLTCSLSALAAGMGAGPEITGSVTASGFFGDTSGTVPLKSGESWSFSFRNKSIVPGAFNNFFLAVTEAPDTTDYAHSILLIRADPYGWGDGIHFPNNDEVQAGSGLSFTSDIPNWEAFVGENPDGFDVTVTVSRETDTLNYSASIGGHTISVSTVSRVSLAETIYLFLTGENCELTNITSSKSGAVTPGPVEPDKDEITIPSFFEGASETLPLKSGEGYTITFHNRSTGNSNWHNFILGVSGADGVTAYDQTILLIRADNAGWGDGVHYPAFAELETTPLPFWTDIADWPAFVQEAQAGFDVTLTVTRDGDTLYYSADMNGHTVSVTAAAREPLPETVYIFLTGESCVLSNITSEIGATPPPPEKPSIEGDLTVSGFFGAVTDALPLNSGETYTFTFRNQSNGTLNWQNFILGVTGSPHANTFDQAILLIRADSYGWGDGVHFPTNDEVQAGNGLPFENDIADWDTFLSEVQAGADVTVTIARRENVLFYTAAIGTHFVKLTAFASQPLDLTYVFLSGEDCTLTGITTTKTEEAPPIPVTPPSVPVNPSVPLQPTVPSGGTTAVDKLEGNLAVNGFFGAVTNTLPIKSGDGYVLKFHNRSNGITNWDNFILAVTGAPDTASFDKSLLILRADSFGWGDGIHFPTIDEANAGNGLSFTTDVTDWAAFVEEAQAGFDVTVTLTRDGDTFYYIAEMNGHTVTLTAVSRKPLPETVYVFLTGENCVLSDISSEGGIEPVPPEEEPVIDGELTVNGFFGAVTDTFPLKSGEGWTFTFRNKSNGSLNWENFILAVTGAPDTPLFDQVLLILRADNFGWGDGVHFPTLDQVSETPLPFETDISDWEAFVQEAQAGVDVTVTVTKSGDTLYYTAKIGSHTVKLKVTSKEPLPETVYVFLTGENCSLSGIKNVSVPHDSIPKTGDSNTLYLWIVLMIVSAMGLVIIGLKAVPTIRKK